MKISTREDIEAPIEHVFAMTTDFDGFERQALRRGAEVSRKDPAGKADVGSEWRAKFKFRGKERDLKARLDTLEPPNGFSASWRVAGLDGRFRADLLSLSPRRTRLTVEYEMMPKSLAARLLVQSLRFARNTLGKRLRARVTDYARTIEDSYRAGG